MKAKFLDALKDPETAAVLEAVLAPIVGAAVRVAMESKEEEIAKLKEELKERRRGPNWTTSSSTLGRLLREHLRCSRDGRRINRTAGPRDRQDRGRRHQPD